MVRAARVRGHETPQSTGVADPGKHCTTRPQRGVTRMSGAPLECRGAWCTTRRQPAPSGSHVAGDLPGWSAGHRVRVGLRRLPQVLNCVTPTRNVSLVITPLATPSGSQAPSAYPRTCALCATLPSQKGGRILLAVVRNRHDNSVRRGFCIRQRRRLDGDVWSPGLLAFQCRFHPPAGTPGSQPQQP